ncbi:hypothetical protein ElyMa_005988400 [Elysia marginata]|uniref:Secreted protein n=1 Tax=Elysia marginata TaxID=1093978 RepID=A0AAV4GG36_9GAST|nr:hypothetical protein ElyMa_005988400 [Elysia marginata]
MMVMVIITVARMMKPCQHNGVDATPTTAHVTAECPVRDVSGLDGHEIHGQGQRLQASHWGEKTAKFVIVKSSVLAHAVSEVASWDVYG